MQKYRGALGNIRRILADLGARLTRSGLTVGSLGWEARLEVQKLPLIVAARMDGLAGRALTPDLRAAVLADVAALEAQIANHEAVLSHPGLRGLPGRGHVAAEDLPAGFADPHADLPPHLLKASLDEGEATNRAEADQFLRDYLGGPISTDPEGAPTWPEGIALLDADGIITPDGRSYLAQELSLAQADMAVALGRGGDADAARLCFRGAVYRLAQYFDVAPGHIVSHLLTDGAAGPVSRLLGGEAAPRVSAEERRAALIADTEARLAQVMQTAPADAFRPEALIQGVRNGDPDAQARLEAMSSAPEGYETVNISAAAIRDPTGAVIDQFNQDYYVKMLELVPTMPDGSPTELGQIMVSYLISEATSTSAEFPQVLFYGYLPPREVLGNRVLQFYDGALRVWRDENGVICQEILVQSSTGRRGFEKPGPKLADLQLHRFPGTEIPLPRTERAHSTGNIWGTESMFGIFHALEIVNQDIQARGIEGFVSRLNAQAPEGIRFMAATKTSDHGANIFLDRIDYDISIVIGGHKLPFATFGIHQRHLRHMEPGSDLLDQVALTPFKFDTTRPTLRPETVEGLPPDQQQALVEGLFWIRENMQELLPVPETIQYARAREARRPSEMEPLLETLTRADTDALVEVADSGQLRDMSPARDGSFDLNSWKADLGKRFHASSAPSFLLFDLRGQHLNDDQRRAIIAAIYDAGKGKTAQKAIILGRPAPLPEGTP